MEYQKPQIPRQKNNFVGPGASQKGFFTVSGISFVLVLLCLISALASVGFVLKKKMTLSSHCAHSVLKLQKDLARPLDRLLRLNKLATSLRLKKKLAQAQLALALTTGNPPAIAAARAKLLVIKQRQLVLKTRQQALLLEARVRREQFHLATLNQQSVIRRTRFLNESSDLAVIAAPPSSLSPSYRLDPRFFEKQGQSYQLKQQLHLPFIGLMNLFNQQKQIQLQTACSASLKRKGANKWSPALKKVKAQWRLSYGSF